MSSSLEIPPDHCLGTGSTWKEQIITRPQMARFAGIDLQIRANRLILADRFRVPEPNPPFFCESRFGGLKIANRRFEALRANRSRVL